MACLPLSRTPRKAHGLRLAVVGLVFAWRLLLAPAHIGFKDFPVTRRLLFYVFTGDRNYLQLLHNTPLFLLGYIHSDIRKLACGRRASRKAQRAASSACASVPRCSARGALSALGWLAVTSAMYVRALSRTAHAASKLALGQLALLGLTFVADPYVFGLFNKKPRGLEDQPMLVYGRGALRVAALAATLPRRTTPFTSAGRSQLFAYLLHDAVFAIVAMVVLPTLYDLATGAGVEAAPTAGEIAAVSAAKPRFALVESRLADLAASYGPVGLCALGAAELAAYAAVCLGVQLALSHPQLPQRILGCCSVRTLKGCMWGAWSRVRFAALQVVGPGTALKRSSSEASAV
jgi:hypothetical protein